MACLNEGLPPPMTETELKQLFTADTLLDNVDIKTLVLDRVRRLSVEEVLPLFYTMLPSLSPDQLNGYLYMKRH
jgi:hypothetical protein